MRYTPGGAAQMNYLIAMIEDSPGDAQTIRDYLDRYSAEHNVTFEIKAFTDCRTFLTGYLPVYDLVLMDINLPDINGMEAAARLRRMDQSVTLVFITSLARYAAKGYEVDATDFLVKPVSYPNFETKLRRALNRCSYFSERFFLIPIPDGVYRISPTRIKYIETSGHALIYHTTEGVIHSSGLLKDVEQRLDRRQFVRCNRCYLVNLAYAKIIRDHVLIIDGDELQISRPKRKTFLAALNDYLGGGV